MPPVTAIRDSIAAVFRQHAYDRVLLQSLWDRFWSWVGDHLRSLILAARGLPGLHWVVVGVLVAIGAAIVAHVVYLVITNAGAGPSLRGHGARGAQPPDPWAETQRLATAGDYTGAAHALYAALLGAIARRDTLRLDPAKTAGDYARALRRSSSPRFAAFREFARAYEMVVYGLGTCDRTRYDRLLAIAAPIVQTAGA
jgi:hypothetical protein